MPIITRFRALIGHTILNELARQWKGVPDVNGRLRVQRDEVAHLDMPELVDAIIENLCEQSAVIRDEVLKLDRR